MNDIGFYLYLWKGVIGHLFHRIENSNLTTQLSKASDFLHDNNYRKLCLELVSLCFSKIVMLQCLKIVIVSPFSNEYILFFSEIETVIITW